MKIGKLKSTKKLKKRTKRMKKPILTYKEFLEMIRTWPKRLKL